MAHLPCPVDCAVGNWGVWSACDRTCGSGVTRRSRTAVTAAAHGGKACPALQEKRQCNAHKCKWKPQCHHKHVHCRVKTVQLSGNSGAEGRLSHVIEVTHDKGYQHVDANYHCRLHADEATCNCFCDKHPPCCSKPDALLANDALFGNKFTNVDDEQACCNMCTNHPHCTAWEYGVGIKVCVLKGGEPQFVHSPSQDVKTVAGLPSGQSCDAVVVAASAAAP